MKESEKRMLEFIQWLITEILKDKNVSNEFKTNILNKRKKL